MHLPLPWLVWGYGYKAREHPWIQFLTREAKCVWMSQKREQSMTQKREIIVRAYHLISLKAFSEVRTAQCASTKVNTLCMPYNLIIRTWFIQWVVTHSVGPFMGQRILYSSRILFLVSNHWTVQMQFRFLIEEEILLIKSFCRVHNHFGWLFIRNNVMISPHGSLSAAYLLQRRSKVFQRIL